jgi:predicted protein tyrosine phosphatase
MNLGKLKKGELLDICAKLGILRCKSKTRAQLIHLIHNGKLDNKGSNAGGHNTNVNGKSFEIATNVAHDSNYVKLVQREFITYMRKMHSICVFRIPDEAYIQGTSIVKILEKKTQSMEGSVETKLWASPSLKREYELVLGDGFRVS